MRKTFAGVAAAAALAGGGTFAADRAVDPYTDKGTHFELPIKPDISQGERVEIAKDRAAMTLKGWNDEYAVTIEPQIPSTDQPFISEGNRTFLSQTMEYREGDVTAFIEPKAGSENEFDIDFTLHSKPDTNVFTYKIEGADEFDFFYQPELTPDELSQGRLRDDNVVGSYAVYHKTKANHCTNCGTPNYGTGKAFHIYRPKAIDANGTEVWAELSYADMALSVTVPKAWLESATYPVRVDPTFGYTGAGASFSSIEDIIRGSAFSTSEIGTGVSMTIRVGGTGSVQTLKTKVYDNSNNPVTNGETTQITVGGSGVRNETLNFASAPSFLSGTTYKLAAWSNADVNSKTLAFDIVGNADFQQSLAYGSWPNPLVPTAQDTRHSIYVTYTAAATFAPWQMSDF